MLKFQLYCTAYCQTRIYTYICTYVSNITSISPKVSVKPVTYCHRAQSFDDSCQGILARTQGALLFGVPSPVGRSTTWFHEYLNKILGSEYDVDLSTFIDLTNKFSVEFGEVFRADSEVFRDLSQSHGWKIFSLYESNPVVTRSGHVFVNIPHPHRYHHLCLNNALLTPDRLPMWETYVLLKIRSYSRETTIPCADFRQELILASPLSIDDLNQYV